MKVVIFNAKGGVGKSTLACHIAFLAMDRRAPVTVIDADQQHNAMMWLSGHSWDGSTSYQEGTVTVTSDVSALDNDGFLTVVDAPPAFEFVKDFPGADVWVVPVGSRFSVTGALNVMEYVKPPARVVLVANMVDANTAFGKRELDEITRVGAELFALPIPRHDVVRRAESLGRASWNTPYGGRATATMHLKAFADWVLLGCKPRGILRE